MSQSKTKTKKYQDKEICEEKFREILAHWDLKCVDLNFIEDGTSEGTPYVVFNVSDMYGLEAHLFTAADMALWIPELLPSGNVVIYHPIGKHNHFCKGSWDTFARFLDWVMHKVRTGRLQFGLPSESWAHGEKEEDGYFEIPEDTPQYIDKILRCVDDYLRDVILELNKNGFVTVSSCSGLKEDHDGKTPFLTHVAFDDEYYLDVGAHLFTLAEASGWDPDFGAHGFHVFFHPHGETQKEIKEAWGRLEEMTNDFGDYLEEYRGLVNPWHEYYFYQFRKRRGLFSQCYDEESLTLTGFGKEINEIDREFYDNDEECSN